MSRSPAAPSGCSDDAARPRRSRKRDAILAAAKELFCAEGYPGTSMDAVATLAAVSKATLYAHFPSKAELFHEVLGCFADSYIRVPDELDARPVDEGLRVLAQRFLDLILSTEALGTYRILCAQGAQFPEMVEVFKSAGPERVMAAVAGYLRRQDERGTLRVPDPRLAAELFLHMTKGEPQFYRLMGLDYPDAAVDARIDEVVRVMLAAYGPPKAS